MKFQKQNHQQNEAIEFVVDKNYVVDNDLIDQKN